MKTINLCFRVHQRINLKRYRFFEIGTDHYYYDDYQNEANMRRAAEACYLAANRLFLDMIESSNGRFKVSFAITGLALEVFEQYSPEVIESFRRLADTGCVEFISTPYAHSLASVYDEDEFVRQVKFHADKTYDLFGKRPTVFANSALTYSDEIGECVSRLGYSAVIVEGAKHVMGWKSPHYIYSHAHDPKLKLIVRDSKLSDDICYRFSQWNWNEYPLTADKFIGWIDQSPAEEEVFNISMGYEALGLLNNSQSGIFDFFRALPSFAFEKGISFSLPSEVLVKRKSVGALSVMYPMSWTDEEKDLSAWTGNELQHEALSKLYKLSERVSLCSDLTIKLDWLRLQDSAHFFFMATRHYVNSIQAFPMPYESPYEAFINYMNVLSDFMESVTAQYPSSIEDEELNALLKTIHNQEQEIARLNGLLKKSRRRTAENE